MKITERPSLQGLNSFGLTATASMLFEIETEEDILALPAFNKDRDLVLGGGSNLVLLSDIPGNVYLNRINGVDIVGEEEDRVVIEAGAGENWHSLVRWSVNQGLSGLENLSLIPGSVGAAPVQNIGAYGAELATVTESVTAWDWQRMQWVTLDRDACRFAYRDSLFKSAEPDRYFITSLRLALSRDFQPLLDYAGLLDEVGKTSPGPLTPVQVSDAVIRIRQRKLPDPSLMGNAGSFFKNPVAGAKTAQALLTKYPGLPAWKQADGSYRLSAAWMIERCGLKGARSGAAGVSDKHALVLVNHGGASGRDVASLAQKVQRTVLNSFGLELEPEPRLVDFA